MEIEAEFDLNSSKSQVFEGNSKGLKIFTGLWSLWSKSLLLKSRSGSTEVGRFALFLHGQILTEAEVEVEEVAEYARLRVWPTQIEFAESLEALDLEQLLKTG